MNVTQRDAALNGKFAEWEISSTAITPGGNGAGSWEDSNVKQYYVRAIEQVGTDRYKQVVLTALNVGSEWYLSDEPDNAEQARTDAVAWLKDAARPWDAVVSWQYVPEFRSASFTAMVTQGQSTQLKHYVLANDGGTFVAHETTGRLQL